MRGLIRRGLRLPLIAAMISLAIPALPAAQQPVPVLSTQTTLTAEVHDRSGRTQVNLSIQVIGEDGIPATGAVSIHDHGQPLAGASLDAQGRATLVLSLAAGDHEMIAAYNGDRTHRGSISQVARANAQATTTPDFQISVSPTSLSLTPGQSGTVTASVTPENASALNAPMFVTLSCSGLPDQSSCVFTPENIEILPNATAPITSSLVVLTQERAALTPATGTKSVSLAILLPGALGLGCLAWSVRRHPWLQRLSLLALVGLVGMLGATACNARYDYYNHGPQANPATPAGTYTVDVTAQSSNGVTATTHTTTLAFTVN